MSEPPIKQASEIITIEEVIAGIDAHLRAHPTPIVLEHWRHLRGHIAALDDQRHIYLAIGVAIGILGMIVVTFIGGTHP